MMTDLMLVSLFDGVGGFPLAFARAGVRTVATVEIDVAASAVTAKHFPYARQFTDVREVQPDDLRAAGFVPDRGIIAAGFPCQDLSVAGKRAGLGGARSGLFWEIVRLADALQPRWFVLENVPGLLSSNDGRDFGTVLGALDELGYGVAWRVLDAQHFGVPQRRRRVFIVGHLGSGSAPVEVLFESEGGERDFASRESAGPEVAGPVAVGAGTPSGAGIDTHTHTHTRTPVSTLQGGGKRGYRIDAEAAAGGHLVVGRWPR